MGRRQAKKNNVLVAGSAGFIGSRVCQYLLEAGWNVLGLDNLNDYYDPLLKKWRLQTLKKYPGFTFSKTDIVNLRGLEKHFDVFRPEAVINLAARAGVRASLKDPWIYLDTNTKGTLNLLECCRKYGAKKFILASTSSIYGLNPYPFREDHDSNRPLTSYAASKKGAEAMAHVYNYLYGIDIVIPRYFTVYGPAGRPDMSVFKFVRRIMDGKTITIFGDGEQKRDFTFVDDIADGTVKALQLSGYHIINLGNDDPIRVLDLVALIERFVGKKARLKFKGRHPADVPDTWADIKLSNKLLKWKPNTPVEEGVERTVAWFKDNYALIRKMQYI